MSDKIIDICERNFNKSSRAPSVNHLALATGVVPKTRMIALQRQEKVRNDDWFTKNCYWMTKKPKTTLNVNGS